MVECLRQREQHKLKQHKPEEEVGECSTELCMDILRMSICIYTLIGISDSEITRQNSCKNEKRNGSRIAATWPSSRARHGGGRDPIRDAARPRRKG